MGLWMGFTQPGYVNIAKTAIENVSFPNKDGDFT